jgi:cell division protein FtsB
MSWLRFRRYEPNEPVVPAPETDAHPAGIQRPRRGAEPEVQGRLQLRRRAVVFALLTLFGLGGMGALVGQGGALEARRLRAEVERLDAEVRQQEATVATLRSEVELLGQDGLARERVAREQLGLMRPGEIDFLLPRRRRDATGGSGGQDAP